MWDETFYIAMIENAAAVHGLLEKITEFIISFIKEVQRIAGNRLNPAGFPLVWAQGKGTMIADDTMSLVSAQMHAEFSLPYINRIAGEAGPVFYHSCSWRKPYFQNIHLVKNVMAYNWNMGNSDDPAQIISEFAGKAVIALHLVKDMHLDNEAAAIGKNFRTEVDFVRYIMDHQPENAVIYLWLSNIIEKKEIIEDMYALFLERGVTPQQVLGRV